MSFYVQASTAFVLNALLYPGRPHQDLLVGNWGHNLPISLLPCQKKYLTFCKGIDDHITKYHIPLSERNKGFLFCHSFGHRRQLIIFSKNKRDIFTVEGFLYTIYVLRKCYYQLDVGQHQFNDDSFSCNLRYFRPKYFTPHGSKYRNEEIIEHNCKNICFTAIILMLKRNYIDEINTATMEKNVTEAHNRQIVAKS